MKRMVESVAAAAVWAAACGGGSASAAVIGATVVDASSGDYTLTSVTVNRAGTVFTYEPHQLTNVDLTDVDAFDIPLVVPGGAEPPALPPAGTRASLIEDWRLDTGVTNVTTTNGSADRSMQVTFATPVVNSVGEDIVLFDLSGGDAVRFWINDDRDGQSATLGNAAFSGNLLSGMRFASFSYKAGTNQNVLSLADLESNDDTRFTARDPETGTVQAVGLDLSLVGVPLGGTVSSIRIQSSTGTGLGRLDPLLIVALPAVPEPTGAAVLAGAAALALTRRTRRSGSSARGCIQF